MVGAGKSPTWSRCGECLTQGGADWRMTGADQDQVHQRACRPAIPIVERVDAHETSMRCKGGVGVVRAEPSEVAKSPISAGASAGVGSHNMRQIGAQTS